MHCFPCFTSPKNKKSSSTDEANVNESTPPERSRPNEIEQPEETTLKTFTFRELATATKNFRQECLLGEGGFGRVYKGTLKNNGHVVAVKQLDKHGLHGSKEFQAEVLSLGRLDHPNLVKLIGYCADGDQRLLVYDYISGGSLHDHLHEQNGEPMDWTRRMQIAYDTAQGIDYLHEKANPPVIYRDLKASNILLDEKFSPKLSDFGLHKLGPGTGDTMMGFSSRVMGTYGYSAPEYTREGTLSMKSDVYSFGVVLLELITGRKAMDTTKPNDEQNLVSWAQPIFRDPKRYPDMADPTMNKRFSERGLNQVVAIASMCVQEEPTARPLISDVMVALSFLSMSTEDGIPKAAPIESFRDKSMSIALSRADSKFVSLEPTMEDDKSCTSSEDDSTSSDNEKEEVSKNMMKKHKENEDSMGESDDECDSNSDDELEKDQNNPSSKPIDEKMAAQSLKIDYRYSWEEVGCNDETLSSKSSHNSNEESTSSRYDSDKDEDDSLMNEEEKEGEKHTHLEHISSSKTDDDEEDDDQSVYFDDDDDSKDDNADSLHQIKSEGDNFIEDKNEKSLHEVKSELEVDSAKE